MAGRRCKEDKAVRINLISNTEYPISNNEGKNFDVGHSKFIIRYYLYLCFPNLSVRKNHAVTYRAPFTHPDYATLVDPPFAARKEGEAILSWSLWLKADLLLKVFFSFKLFFLF
jgi:hypothetical protein